MIGVNKACVIMLISEKLVNCQICTGASSKLPINQ